MNSNDPQTNPELRQLPNFTLRQLEIFRSVCREGSFANAALEVRSTRANVKRLCADFEKIIGRPLFENLPDGSQQATPFAKGLLAQMGALSASLRQLEENVRRQHARGRTLRFAAAADFFQGTIFVDFLTRLGARDHFRPCFLKIEAERFPQTLIHSECDAYFGVNLEVSTRLDAVCIGFLAWLPQAPPRYELPLPESPDQLLGQEWFVTGCTEKTGEILLEQFRKRGAQGGAWRAEHSAGVPAIAFRPDYSRLARRAGDCPWPSLEFTATLRKQHPYSELLPWLRSAGIYA